MKTRLCSIRSFAILCVTVLTFSITGQSDAQNDAFLADVGWTALLDELGAPPADGSSLAIAQTEASNGVRYMPDSTLAEFSGITFTDGTGTGNGSFLAHATRVGRSFYGDGSGMASGINDVTIYSANDWINRVTGFSSGGDPLAQQNAAGRPFDVHNHSYVGNGNPNSVAQDIAERMDFIVNRDNTTHVVGTNNGRTTITPQLFAHSYNVITVGRSDGEHATRNTRFYGAGRIKPDIVAPRNLEGPQTSWSTAGVSSAAAILREVGAGTNATQNEVVKAILMAGATKNEPEFSAGENVGWSRTSTRPIDTRFGAGELNVRNSYNILQGGENEGSSGDPVAAATLNGWDYDTLDAGDALFYKFELTGDTAEASILLTWNIDVRDNNASSAVFDASTLLADFDLEFYDSTGGFLDVLLDSSISSVDNVEHIYLTDLGPGVYTLKVDHLAGSPLASHDFGLAWRFSAIPEPTTFVGLFLAGLPMALRRRRTT